MIIVLCHVYDFGESTVTVIKISLSLTTKSFDNIDIFNIEKPIAIGLFGFT
jgi:hypothetical protein